MGDLDATSTAARAGAEIRHARKNRGWTQEQLAHEAGVATNTLGAVEDGRATRRGSLAKICAALGLDPKTVGADYPADIGVARELVGQWLLTIPAPERIRAIRTITRAIVTYKSDNPGQPDDADAELAQMLMNG